VIMICVICNSEFKKRVHNQKICSDKCTRIYRTEWSKLDRKENPRIKKELNCKSCGKKFYASNTKGNPKSCSIECKKRLNDERIRSFNYKKKYGITLSEYNRMLIEQWHCCKICGKHESDLNYTLKVDHCHTTGAVRGLLCNECNVGISMLKENKIVFKNAMKYLNLNA